MWAFSRQVLKVPGEGLLYGKLILGASVLFLTVYLAGSRPFLVKGGILALGLAGYMAVLTLTGLFRRDELRDLIKPWLNQ